VLVVTDIDNVLCDLNALLQERFVIDLGRYPNQVPHAFFASPEGLSLFWRARPFACSAESLWGAVAAGHRILYLTSRPREASFVTRRWLALHNFPSGEVVLTQDKLSLVLPRRHEILLVAEDDPRVALALAGEGVPVLLVDWPYNRGLVHPLIRRAPALPGIGRVVAPGGGEGGARPETGGGLGPVGDQAQGLGPGEKQRS
jgi:hypothetical protein